MSNPVSAGATFRLPPGLRVYVVGDIHGRFDLLQALATHIRADLGRSRPARAIEIFLGDYVDRGPGSRDVLEWLATTAPIADERICLMGNHEAMLLSALERDRDALIHWLENGGAATLASYGITAATARGWGFSQLNEEFARRLPPAHLVLLRSLTRTACFGDYLFVHAGIRPGCAIPDQDPEELIWIREPFLHCEDDFGCMVVHGHTPVELPEIRPNRINIDTGAFFSGRLTCLVLEGEVRRFIQACAD